MKRFLLALGLLGSVALAAEKPNVVFILCDDLAQGDLGCYGQKLIQTPNLDRMASEGTRYTQAYSGTSVCAPSRTSLMTGLDMGHSPVRANREIGKGLGQMPLPPGTVTVASMLKASGYATACTGKWGMGMPGSSGEPLKLGFDRFYGYYDQVHAHDYFTSYLFDNDKLVELPEKSYSQNFIQKATLDWVRSVKDKPFFLFYAVTLPHGDYEIDSLGIYADKPWTPQQKTYAAMVSRLDRDVGELLALLKELKLDENTLVMFSGDNGSSFGPGTPVGKLFDQSMGGKLRDNKRSMFEGGLRQASIARWPGKVTAGRVSDEPWAFWDFMPTVAEITGAKIPATWKSNGLSLVDFLKGGKAPQRPFFYWELHEGQPSQAIRFGDWKAVRPAPNKPMLLFDLKTDSAETKDLAAEHPELVKKAVGLMNGYRTADPNWPDPAGVAGKRSK